MNHTSILIKVISDGSHLRTAAAKAFGAAQISFETILTIPPPAGPRNAALAQGPAATWMRLGLSPRHEHPWENTHALLETGFGLAGPAVGVLLAEPDIEQTWPWALPQEEPGVGLAAGADRCAFLDQDKEGGKATGPGPAWNARDDYSEFRKARSSFGPTFAEKLREVVVAHLDTGYDPNHVTRPTNLDNTRQHNFVDADTPDDARDRTPEGGAWLRNRGHGTATLALLAGNALSGNSPGWRNYSDCIGGAPYVTVIPIRIADWVVRFSTGTMVQGFEHAIRCGAHILSMSMGGLASAALTDAVNLAYESGLFMVTAAGNNYAWTPSPKSIVFPARWQRVLAACGVMADGRAYAGLHPNTMQGNYGPPEKMLTALGAYTPNVPWAVIGCSDTVGMDGAGTSSATPQIAAAAALWLAEHWDAVMAYPEPWMRVESIRQALFASAAKSTPNMNQAETLEKIGQGVLKADAALREAPLPAQNLDALGPARNCWSFLDLIFDSGGVSLAPEDQARTAMFKLELTQMAQRVAAVEQALPDVAALAESYAGQRSGDSRITAAMLQRYLEAALDAGSPSGPLQHALEGLLSRTQAPPPPPKTSARCVRRKPAQLPSPRRRLRVYALDPIMGKTLQNVPLNETVLALDWEEVGLGPVGEYLEVVDVDPSSNRFYDPVDLNHPWLLAQDGWTPSEGNPQFHQQMVYAVAMTIIRRFEEALGRKALWSPRLCKISKPDGEKNYTAYEVPRLRLYPHALRTSNAYYSQEKKAILFGYFKASPRDGDVTAPGSMVFSCLSSDIIAHEMTHALLDGLHRRFQEPSNPDVLAFHEAFADIIALFHHFTIAELVRAQIAQARGKLNAAGLLGGLARQFGEAVQRGGPLRDYLGDEVRRLDYATTFEVHARGSILVAAVFDAFLKIVDNRTADLIRIATGGSGIFPDGALHPDLVDRLANEACKVAGHMMRMCIRALDYAPAVDITFGEFLRALITADIDMVPNDPHHYRVAYMEAFGSRGLLPHDVRTISEESLCWQTLDEYRPAWLNEALGTLDLGWDRDISRSEIFRLNEKNRWALRNVLSKAFANDPCLCTQFGLLNGVPRYNWQGNPIRIPKDGATTYDVFSVRPARRVTPDGSFRTEVVATILQRRPIPMDPKDVRAGWFWFYGGATLLLDPREGHREIRYSIIKNSDSERRIALQRRTVSTGMLSPLRALYFGDMTGEPFALLHADNGEDDHDD
uniref:Subtilisin-like serine protease n=1 Tax=Desulfovibrio sp. U5L TaxID=596152 RepID=I2PZD9_9BACT